MCGHLCVCLNTVCVRFSILTLEFLCAYVHAHICIRVYLFPFPFVLDQVPRGVKVSGVWGTHMWLPHSTSSLTLWGTLKLALWVFYFMWFCISFPLIARQFPICTLGPCLPRRFFSRLWSMTALWIPSWPGTDLVFILSPPQDQQVVDRHLFSPCTLRYPVGAQPTSEHNQ